MSVVAGLNFYIADNVANLGANVYLVDRFGIITSHDTWIKARSAPWSPWKSTSACATP